MNPPLDLLCPGRRPQGLSAILLPFRADGEIDFDGFRAHVQRTVDAGLVPAINMDTGFGHLLNLDTKVRTLEITKSITKDFVAGAFCQDKPGSAFNRDEYARQIEVVQSSGGTPVIFQSYGLVQQKPAEIVAAYASLAEVCDAFIGFELTTDLAPFGSVYDLETYEGLMSIERCIGAKHSSFHREPEWERLRLRNEKRPDFRVYTGNDFGIDMIMYGSDYLLGLSTFAPDLFAKRDDYWESGDPGYYELNDQLQYLGFFAFRSPGSAYKHTAAQFMKLRGWIDCDNTHPGSLSRPDSDVAILSEILDRFKSEHGA